MFRRLIEDFPIIHASVGLAGNAMFFIGSIFFLKPLEAWKPFGVWLFILGALFMLLGATGDWLLKHFNYETSTLSLKQKRGEQTRAGTAAR